LKWEGWANTTKKTSCKAFVEEKIRAQPRGQQRNILQTTELKFVQGFYSRQKNAGGKRVAPTPPPPSKM